MIRNVLIIRINVNLFILEGQFRAKNWDKVVHLCTGTDQRRDQAGYKDVIE